MAEIAIFTDGAALGNPGPGGYGIVMESGQYRKEISKGFRLTTNNRMELLAVIDALKLLIGGPHNVAVYSDSKYVVDCIEKKWINNWIKTGFKDKKNVDLWKEIIPLLKVHKVRFVWIKGHAGHIENELCDKLAVSAAKNGLKHSIDKEFERLKV